MSDSDPDSDAEQPTEGKCCGEHEVRYGAGRPCKGCNWRCVFLGIIDKFLKNDGS